MPVGNTVEKTLVHLDCDTRAVPASRLRTATHEQETSKNAKSGHSTRKIVNYSNAFAKMKKSKFLMRGMLGVIFFVPALRSSLLLYSKRFALLTFKNGVEIAAVGGGAASIREYRWPRRPQSSGVVLL